MYERTILLSILFLLPEMDAKGRNLGQTVLNDQV